jgi:gamma-glutamylcyclotransferase (GGCT)/AIG2-like uncharacterized protein YtfP
VRVFVYGTLMVPELVEALTGQRPRARFAELEGFERRAVRGEVYPAIVPAPGGRVAGLLLDRLPTHRLAFLDAFEGDEYRRSTRRVRLADDRHVLAWCWSWAPDRRRALEAGPWDMDVFLRDALPDYLRRCRRLGRAFRVPRASRAGRAAFRVP